MYTSFHSVYLKEKGQHSMAYSKMPSVHAHLWPNAGFCYSAYLEINLVETNSEYHNLITTTTKL